MGAGKKIAVTAILGTLAGAVAGVLLSPKSGKETRKDIQDAANKIKKQVAQKVSKLKKFTKKDYDKIVGQVMAEYNAVKAVKKFSQEDLNEIATDIKNRWEDVEKEVSKKKVTKKVK